MVKTTNQLLVIYWVIYPSGFPWDPHLLMILLNFDVEISWNIPIPEIPKGPEISQRSPRDLQDELHMNSSENLDLTGTGQVTPEGEEWWY